MVIAKITDTFLSNNSIIKMHGSSASDEEELPHASVCKSLKNIISNTNHKGRIFPCF